MLKKTRLSPLEWKIRRESTKRIGAWGPQLRDNNERAFLALRTKWVIHLHTVTQHSLDSRAAPGPPWSPWVTTYCRKKWSGNAHGTSASICSEMGGNHIIYKSGAAALLIFLIYIDQETGHRYLQKLNATFLHSLTSSHFHLFYFGLASWTKMSSLVGKEGIFDWSSPLQRTISGIRFGFIFTVRVKAKVRVRVLGWGG